MRELVVRALMAPVVVGLALAGCSSDGGSDVEGAAPDSSPGTPWPALHAVELVVDAGGEVC